jgi:hypothetical protein
MSDTATTAAAAPIIAALQPYLTAAATAIVGGMITLAAAVYKKWTGIQIGAANLAAIKAAAETEAGKAVAAAADNLVNARIDVGSPIVTAASDAIARRLPDFIKASGITTDDIDHLVAGEIGKLQARMTAVTVPAAPAS